jgi:hypothetical protein
MLFYFTFFFLLVFYQANFHNFCSIYTILVENLFKLHHLFAWIFLSDLKEFLYFMNSKTVLTTILITIFINIFLLYFILI